MKTMPFRALTALVTLALLLLSAPTPVPLKALNDAEVTETHFSGFSAPSAPSVVQAPADSTTQARLEQAFGQLPLYFVENQGQVDGQVAYYVQGSDKTIYFTSEGVTFALTEQRIANSEWRIADKIRDTQYAIRNTPHATHRWSVKLDFIGANPDVRPVGEDKTDAIISYFKGTPDEWHTGLPTYSRIVYRDLWPGIDLVYYGTVNQLKYEFVVQPGADPAQIRLRYRGATGVTLNAEGQLEVSTPLGSFTDDTPVAYQEIDGQRVDVPATYALQPAAERLDHESREIARNPRNEAPLSRPSRSFVDFVFQIAPYDPTRPLILDPAVLVYCGYIGGADSDHGRGIAVDNAGNAYVTGGTGSTEAAFPTVVGPDLTYNGGNGDAFIAKVNAVGTALLYAGYIGGAGADMGYGIAVDGAGNAYVTGDTKSDATTFPVVGGPDLTFNGGHYDAFVVKVNAAGTALVHAGYIGGADSDHGWGIAVDSAGNTYVTGSTGSTETTFPTIVGPDLTYNGGDSDAFVAKINSAGTGMVYAGYIGGSEIDKGYSIAVDGVGNAYVAGDTFQTFPFTAEFPATLGPDLTYNGGDHDAFVAKVSATGTALVYAGYIGGYGDDRGYGIAVDGAGNAYVTGLTDSYQDTFPVIVGPDLTHNGGWWEAFVAKVSAGGASLVYAGYIGGSQEDGGYGITVDETGNAYVVGWTASAEATFPVADGPDLTYNGGFCDAFVAKVNAAGAGLVYAGYIGGDGRDEGYGIVVDGVGNVYVTGVTASAEATFPVTVGPDLTFNGGVDPYTYGGDAFVTKAAVVSYYSISGQVRDSSDAPVASVSISAGAGYTATTGADGDYTLNDLPSGAYALTPSQPGCLFTPPSRTVSVPPDATGQDFVIRCAFDVSGHVRDASGNPFASVQVSAGAGRITTTNASGQYVFTQIVSGTYTLTPTLAGYTFQPTARTVSVPPDATGQDFTILPVPVSITLPLSGTLSLPDCLVYTDTQSLTTTVCLPRGALHQVTTVVLTPTLAQDGAGWTFAGHAFELAAFQEGVLQPTLALNRPATVTIQYSPQDVRLVSDVAQLALQWWTGSGWENAVDTCAPPSAYERDLSNRVIGVPICRLSQFGLFGPTHQVYLPSVLRSY